MTACAAAAAGCRMIVPYLRGYGPTRFLSADTMRSGEQAALGNDLKEMMDALGIERAVLAGYDWGGRAACIVAALWPERVRGLVTGGGYNMHDVAGSVKPASAEPGASLLVSVLLLHRARPRGLTENRRDIAKAALDAVVAELDLRRRDVRGERALVRQSGFRRSGDPLLSRALRLCAGRSGACGDRSEARREAEDHGAGDHAAGRGDRHGAAGSLDRPCATFHRAATSAAPFRASATISRQEAPRETADAVMELAGV